MSIIKILLLGCLLFSGCSTYRTNKYTTDTFKDYQFERDGLFIRFEPVTDKEKSAWYLNIPPAKYDLMPVFICIQNRSGSIKKINTDDAYLTDNTGQTKYPVLSVEKTVKKLQSAGWIPALMFGMAGSATAGAVESSKDDDIYRKAFKPRIIDSGCTGQGLLFFNVSKEAILNNEFILCFTIDDLGDSRNQELKFPFKTR